MKKFALLALVMGASTHFSSAAVSFTGAVINDSFSSFDGTLAPTGWDADGFSAGSPGFTELRGASTGGVGTGGTYAFDIGGGNTALGVQPGGDDFTPGYYQLEVVNNLGVGGSNWSVSFKSFSFNDQARGNSFEFSYSTDGTNYTAVPAGTFTSGEVADGAPAWTLGVDYSETLAVPVADGGSLYLRWTGNDVSGSGSRDEFALDDVVVVPEPSTALLGSFALLGFLRRKR